MSTDEQSLWPAAVAGDSAAFGAIFDLHRPRLYRHSLRLVNTRTDAEDVVAVAFLELWRRRYDVRTVGGSVLPWLLVTATNAARNVSRSTRRYRALLDRLPRSSLAADPAQVLEERSVLHGVEPDLLAELRGLPALDQQVLALIALEGYSAADAAEVLGLSVSAVRARLHRTRTRLRRTGSTTYLREVTP